MKKILFIVGSLREKSFNRQLAKKAESILKGKAEVKYLDFTDLPFVNQDKEVPELGVVHRIRKEVSDADALWVFTPEYNYSYPGIVKNLFDWLSRPIRPGDYATPTCINGKKVALSGASGKSATSQCRAKLTDLLTFIKADVLNFQTGVSIPPQSWASDVLELSDDDVKHLEEEAEIILK